MKSADNTILREFRLWDDQDADTAFEWAYQANRLAAENFLPIPADRGFHDPSGPVTRAESEASGEDYYYYWVMRDLATSTEEIDHAAAVLTWLYVFRRTEA